MNVLIITQYFPPEIGAAASRWGDFAKILIKQNHKVTVICESPHYPNEHFFSGYKNTLSRTEREGAHLTIIRTLAYASNRRSTLKKITHYFTFMIGAILNLKKIKSYDLIIVSSPPLSTAIIGLFISKFFKKSYWLDIRDLWPDSVVELGQMKRGKIFQYSKRLEKNIYASAKGFIFPVPAFRGYLQKYPSEISTKPMFDLMNGVSSEFIKASKNCNVVSDKIFTVLYSGNMGLAQDLQTIIKAATYLKNYKIHFKLIGQGVCKTEMIKLAQPLKTISFYDPMPRNELIKHIKKSSVCLVPLKNKKIFNFALPSKMFEYMACEKPIIVGVNGEAKKLLKVSKSGIHVQPENSKMLSEAILKYFNNKNKIQEHGKNGLKYITDNLEKEVLISNLIQKIKSNFE